VINKEIIPEIADYNDLLKKLEFDMKRYRTNNHSYELIDCIMTLNALPEWITKTESTSMELREIANEKISIMKGRNGFEFDETLISSEIDHQLRFIRLFCNHTKHKTESGIIPKIISRYGATFPMTLPAKLFNMIALGKTEFDAEFLIMNIYEFWKKEIEK
jgi:hypothetical protein